MGPGFDQAGANVKAIKKASAGRVQIDGGCVPGAQCIRDNRGRVGAEGIDCKTSQQDQVYVVGLEICRGQCVAGCHQGHVGEITVTDSTFLDAGAGGNPLVRSFHERFQVLVAQHGWRYTFTPSGNLRKLHS